MNFNPNTPYPSQPFGADYPPPSYEQANHSTPFPPASNPQPMSRDELFRQIIQKYEISHDYANKLQYLNGFKICFIFDDSSSMNSVLEDSPLNKSGSFQKATRWNELEYFANIAIELANLFDQNGCDVYFLNKQPPCRNIKNPQEFISFFKQLKPYGYTPLTRTLNQVLADQAQLVTYEKAFDYYSYRRRAH